MPGWETKSRWKSGLSCVCVFLARKVSLATVVLISCLQFGGWISQVISPSLSRLTVCVCVRAHARMRAHICSLCLCVCVSLATAYRSAVCDNEMPCVAKQHGEAKAGCFSLGSCFTECIFSSFHLDADTHKSAKNEKKIKIKEQQHNDKFSSEGHSVHHYQETPLLSVWWIIMCHGDEKFHFLQHTLTVSKKMTRCKPPKKQPNSWTCDPFLLYLLCLCEVVHTSERTSEAGGAAEACRGASPCIYEWTLL